MTQYIEKNRSNYQRSVLALQLEDVFKGKAKEKQKEAGGAVPQISAKAPIETRKELSKVAAVSHDTIAKGKKNISANKGGTSSLSTIDKEAHNTQKAIFKGNQHSAPLPIIDNEPKHNTRKIVSKKLGWSTGKKAMFDVVKKKAPEEVKAKERMLSGNPVLKSEQGRTIEKTGKVARGLSDF